MEKFKKIISNPFLKLSVLEKAIGCSGRALYQFRQGKSLADHWVWASMAELAKEGMYLDGWVIRYDPEIHGFLCKKDQDKDPIVIEHRRKATGEVYSVENPPDEETDIDYTQSWFEYQQSQTRHVITDEHELIQFLDSL